MVTISHITRKAFWPWQRRLHIQLNEYLYTLCGKTPGWWGTYEINNKNPSCGKCMSMKEDRDKGVREMMDMYFPKWKPEDCCGNKESCCGGAFEGNGS